ncbi:MAG: sensor histidine kinase [Acidimicrobiales bacterium]
MGPIGKRPGPSLRRRLVLGLMAVLVVMIAGLGTAGALVLRDVLYQRSARGLRTELQLLVASEAGAHGSSSATLSSCSVPAGSVIGAPPRLPPPRPGSPGGGTGPTLSAGAATAVSQVLAQRGVASAVVGPGGAVLACATAARTGPRAGFTVPSAVTEHMPALGGPGSYVTLGSQGRHLLAISQPVGADTAILVTDLAGDDAAVRTVVLVTVLGGTAALVIAALLSRPLITSGLAPLRKVARTADAIAAGDIGQRASLSRSSDEVGRLGTAFDAMIDRLQASMEQRDELVRQLRSREQAMRQFVADASHELRTPLTAIRGGAQVLRLGAASDPEELAESLDHIQAQAERMSQLVSDLLMLSRHDDAGLAACAEPLDLAALVEGETAQWQSLYRQRPISVSTEEAWVKGDRHSLLRLATNLVDNATKYSPPGSPVEVTVRHRGTHAELAVADHGPGIAVEDRERVFERFYRGDPARARATGGAGLGLAIVAGIAADHRGTAEAGGTPGGGARLVVTLPLLGSPHSQEALI